MSRDLIDPDMPAQELRLHMGEMTAQEMRTARAAIRWANTRLRAALEAEASEGERRGLERAAEEAEREIEDAWAQGVGRADGDNATLKQALTTANLCLAVAAAIRALIHEAPSREGWQPIETAPRDGSEIILHDRGTVGTGFYSEAPEARRAEAGWFWEDDRGNLLIAKNADPTHWMPLPSPPQDREGQ